MDKLDYVIALREIQQIQKRVSKYGDDHPEVARVFAERVLADQELGDALRLVATRFRRIVQELTGQDFDELGNTHPEERN